MKIIFLDIDGVLNNAQWAAEHGYGGWVHAATKEAAKWCPYNVENLRKILDAVPEAVVVISSTWRRFFTVDQFNELFTLYGLKKCVIGRTPGDDRKLRGLEVMDWLKKYPDHYFSAHVILDDIGDQFRRNQPTVITDDAEGLTEKDAEEAIAILTRVPAEAQPGDIQE